MHELENNAGLSANLPPRPVVELESVVIRFAGDSGDGMQLSGTQFSDAAAAFGNDLVTFPDFPAEIRAPVGTRAGVSAYQVHFSATDIQTPGDALDALVAMNAAALQEHLSDLKPGGLLLLDTAGFDERNRKLANCKTNPLEDGSLAGYRVVAEDLTTRTVDALASTSLRGKDAKRCKNLFALGMTYWIYGRPLHSTKDWLHRKFAAKPQLAQANIIALTAGYNYAETLEIFGETYAVPPAVLPKGNYRKLGGNEALALGLVAASKQANRPLFLGSYPITPASSILHELAKLKRFGVITFQAEDEIAAVCSAIGASFTGAIGATSTSGPGMCLKAEAMNLAVMAELPLVVVNVQRGGPSTGLPTKTEQSDLLQALFGRNGDSPVPVLAPRSPAHCFDIALEAVRVSIKYMTPVVILSDGYIANGTEPWRIPQVQNLPDLCVSNAQASPEKFLPYRRNSHGGRPWAVPGTTGLEHRIGGLETERETGAISYEGKNHEIMTFERARKIQEIARDISPVELVGKLEDSLLVVSWGGTWGSTSTAVRRLREAGRPVASIHLEWLNPFPANLGEILHGFKGQIVVPELNNGQMQMLLQGTFGLAVRSIRKIQGRPFQVSELVQELEHLLQIFDSNTEV